MDSNLTSVFVAVVAASLSAPLMGQQADHADGAEKLGNVRFEVSCAAAVQPKFNRAVALYHSFHWVEGTKAFREIAQLDPKCGMAYWGLAMIAADNPFTWPGALNLKEGPQLIEKAKEVGAGTQRERDYIEALGQLYNDHANTPHRARAIRYEEAMGKLAARYPNDLEARVLYGLAISANHDLNDSTYERPLKAVALLEPLFKAHPDHPGVPHYIIHSYDYPPLADKARAAARRYAGIAPTAAHALHMPSHTFTRVGMWQESISTNERSMRVALSNGSIAEAMHAADYAMYANMQLGRNAAARAILDTLPTLQARFNPDAITGAAPASAGFFAMASIPARWALERRAWADAAALEPRATAYPYTEAMTYFTRALGASRTGDLAKAKASADSLASIQARLKANGEGFWTEQVAIQALAATAWIHLAEGRVDSALVGMREAVRREDATEKNAVTPGPLVPARELLADMLVILKRPDEAKTEYQATLKKEPGRRHSLRGAGLATSR